MIFLFLKALLLINLVYFALIGLLTWKTLHQPVAWKRNERFLRLCNSAYRTWLEFNPEWCLPAFNVRNKSGKYVLIQIYWIFGKLWLHWHVKPWFRGEWGVSFTDIDGDGWQQVHVHYGYHRDREKDERYKIFDMPWVFDYCQTWYQMKVDGEFQRISNQYASEKTYNLFKSLLLKQTFPYLYVLKDGTPQHRYATINQEERKWRRKWLPFTDLFGLTRRTINIEFDREVGEGIKSWKGATLGCSYLLKPGESGEECLRRMEATRRFDR